MYYQENKPRYVYKYKSVSNKTDLMRVLDIIESKRIYLPQYGQLNDPLEGSVMCLWLSGYAGSGISMAADVEDNYVKEQKEKYRILSLGEKNNDPLMWAHYADDYKGVCLCFQVDDRFKKLKKVDYYEDKIDIRIEGGKNEIKKYVEESFFKKLNGWSYEKEWRLLKPVKQEYFDVNHSLCGIIIGHNMDVDTQKIIVKAASKRLKVFKTYIGYRTVGVGILSYGYNVAYGTGKPIKYIEVEKDLDRFNKKR